MIVSCRVNIVIVPFSVNIVIVPCTINIVFLINRVEKLQLYHVGYIL